MRFTTKTEYGLVCLIYMARSAARDPEKPVTIKELVQAEVLSQTYTEKIMQALRNSDIVKAQHGNQGGYSLSRPSGQISLREIVEALEGSTFEVFCQPEIREEITCTHFSLCGIKPIWWKTKEVLDRLYDGISLEMIARNELESNIPEQQIPAN